MLWIEKYLSEEYRGDTMTLEDVVKNLIAFRDDWNEKDLRDEIDRLLVWPLESAVKDTNERIDNLRLEVSKLDFQLQMARGK
jgi:hypothetical protein